ncbi:MMPL family transporter [Planomonospora parontospora]|uniref:MMPL family transporter n=1 Tax=Planomonospora parontospora TaxID=58119 RepID=UPI001999F201|nr:hypothetical protein GCM10014719_21850 [Planomonospora parontospora subsp. antibiotica]GII13741.1 hypothetical protein Ppa05_04670 [Planomonospora parontospora subsp. antibiotica]
MAGLFALSSVVELTTTAPILALMLGLAVGIDYSLFITSRHRQNLADGLEPEEAAARAVGTAGSAVVFAGATVVIALAGLVVVGIPFLSIMGLAAAGTVAVAVLVAAPLAEPRPARRRHRGRAAPCPPRPGGGEGPRRRLTPGGSRMAEPGGLPALRSSGRNRLRQGPSARSSRSVLTRGGAAGARRPAVLARARRRRARGRWSHLAGAH